MVLGRPDAEDPGIAAIVAAARFIYIPGAPHSTRAPC